MKAAARPKLLVVDDHERFRTTVREIFEGYAVVREADSGEAALREYQANPPDWIIMDLRMPGMGGLKATREILQLNPGARIILISESNRPIRMGY